MAYWMESCDKNNKKYYQLVGTRGNRERIEASEFLGQIIKAVKENKEGIKIRWGEISGDLHLGEVQGKVHCCKYKYKDTEYGYTKEIHNVEYRELDIELDIRRTTFLGRVFFGSEPFGKSSDEKKIFSTQFNRRVRFLHVTFEQYVNFTYVKFYGGVDFRHAKFLTESRVNFRYTTFSNHVDFSGVRMNRLATFYRVKFQENTIFAWLRSLFYKQKKITHFRGFNTDTIMEKSSNPYLKRYIDDQQWIRGWRHRGWWRQLLFIIWEVTSRCGRSFLLWAFWSIIISVIFGLIYAPFSCPSQFPEPIQDFFRWADPQIHIDSNTYNHPIWTSIYFSIVTFTTLGFGDVQPKNGAGLFWVGFEVILGYIMLGGLISIFANKLARRS